MPHTYVRPFHPLWSSFQWIISIVVIIIIIFIIATTIICLLSVSCLFGSHTLSSLFWNRFAFTCCFTFTFTYARAHIHTMMMTTFIFPFSHSPSRLTSHTSHHVFINFYSFCSRFHSRRHLLTTVCDCVRVRVFCLHCSAIHFHLKHSAIFTLICFCCCRCFCHCCCSLLFWPCCCVSPKQHFAAHLFYHLFWLQAYHFATFSWQFLHISTFSCFLQLCCHWKNDNYLFSTCCSPILPLSLSFLRSLESFTCSYPIPINSDDFWPVPSSCSGHSPVCQTSFFLCLQRRTRPEFLVSFPYDYQMSPESYKINQAGFFAKCACVIVSSTLQSLTGAGEWLVSILDIPLPLVKIVINFAIFTLIRSIRLGLAFMISLSSPFIHPFRQPSTLPSIHPSAFNVWLHLLISLLRNSLRNPFIFFYRRGWVRSSSLVCW